MRPEAAVAASSVPDVSHSLLPPSYVFLPSPSRPLLVLVLIGSAFSHYWWLIGYCICLSFPFSRRWHNMSDTTISFAFMFLLFIKNIVSVSPYWCFLGNSVSTYRIRYPYPYPCRLDSDLDCVSLFWDFVARYSDSVLFCYSLRHFLDFVGHFWDFVHVLQWLGHFYYSDSVILRFCQSFWDFVIHFFVISLAIFEISSWTVVTRPFCYSA
jgi:hypothetical protein